MYKFTNFIVKDRNKATLEPLQSPFADTEKLQRDIEALKGIIANLRKQKVYAGQRFYNPQNHKAPIVYLCARWNDWYMVRQQNEVNPRLIEQAEWQETYGHYLLMHKSNTNLKNLR